MLLQKVLNLSEMKLPPESDIIFFGILYSAKITLHVYIRLSPDWIVGGEDSKIHLFVC